eukprot:TRINITY_DN3253_c0_g1_i1.p1 TRINITY_DN3253_c0_g1~~TRINITY_DN3253_c0_g1_i1.p1  ORF type:complete len:235 (-),score=68.57 TRINITY_DN3253_c0_g1_i1:141-845(-)
MAVDADSEPVANQSIDGNHDSSNGVIRESSQGKEVENGTLSKKKAKEIEKRRRRRKQKKKNKITANGTHSEGDSEGEDQEEKENKKPLEDVEIEYVVEKADFEDQLIENFKSVFEKFQYGNSLASGKDGNDAQDANSNQDAKTKADSDSDEDDDQEKQNKEKGISNKKKKLQRRMKIAELKQLCTRPDVVEVWDATAADPKLLVYLKAYRNTVPVPRHWCQKRKFLQGAVHPCL